MAGLHPPLSTLRRTPHDVLRMTRGQHESLLLRCRGLPPLTPCRSPSALLDIHMGYLLSSSQAITTGCPSSIFLRRAGVGLFRTTSSYVTGSVMTACCSKR